MGIYSALLVMAAGLPAIQAAVPTLSGWTLAWSDDFVGTANSLPSSSNWVYTSGTSYPGGAANFGTGEIQTYTSSTNNVRLTGNGTLEIKAIKDSAGKWTSARIETQRTNFAAAEGKKMRMQGSLSLPVVGNNGIGIWPAFWSLGSLFRDGYTNWPGAGELDIMENINGINKLYGTMHCGTAPGGECNENDGRGANTVPAGSALQGNFHTYTVEIDRTQTIEAVRWYLDDKLYWQVTSDQLSTAVWAATCNNAGYYMLLNIAIGGSFPDKIYGATTPIATTVGTASMLVDYVAVYTT